MKEQHSPLNCLWLSIFLLLLTSGIAKAQEKVSVQDEKGNALISVYVNFNNIQITTDLQGVFSIPSTLADTTVLRFEYLGYKDYQTSLANIRDNKNYVILHPDQKLLEEVVIIGRTASSERDMPNQIKRIDANEIFSSAAQSSADALEIAGGVFVQKSQMGGGSPVLRGFEANKVLLVVDGIRMNNAIYRNGHLQNAITVDPSMLERMDIIFGAGSLLYGSEALGGVIHFQSRSPEFNFNPTQKSRQSLNAYMRYNSSNHEKRTHLNYGFGKEKWAVISSISFVDFDDLRAGSQGLEEYPGFGLRPDYVTTSPLGIDSIILNENSNIQKGTAYSQIDLMQKWSFKLSPQIQSQFNIQYSSSSDIPRYDNLIARSNGTLRFAEWYYGPQKRFLAAHHLKVKSNSLFMDRAIIIASFQKLVEDRFSREFGSELRESQFEDLKVYGFTADMKKRLSIQHNFLYGVDLQYNQVDSEAFLLQNPYGENPERKNELLSRYPSGGSSLLNMGAYLQYIWQNKDSSLRWINGIRYSWQEVRLSYRNDDPFNWPSYFYDGIQSRNSALVGVSGLNYYSGHFRIKASSGTSFRSPNVDDLAKIRVNNDEITIPNPNLGAENVWNNEISVAYQKSFFKLSATAYYSLLSGVIVRQQTQLPDGSSFFVSRGDSLLVTGNFNAESGSIRGFSVQLDLEPTSHWSLNTQFNLQKGSSTDEQGNEMPLGHIPPSFGMGQLKYSANMINVNFNARYNAWKNIDDFGGSVDNPELATADGSPSFLVLSLGAEYSIDRNWNLSGGINNITDAFYRPFASGLSGPGRHIFIALAYRWRS